MPTVNERCKILRSLNRVYVFEIVLLLVPRLKILRRRGLSYFGILRNKRLSRFPKKQTTTNEPKSRVSPMVYLHAGLVIGSAIPYAIH